jgi:hypothetical protein
MTEVSLDMAATDQGVGVSAFFTENMATFREHVPHVHARLAEIQTPHSRLVIEDDGAIDIAFGDRRFYGEDAVAFTESQIESYFAKPERRYIDHLDFGFKDGIEGRLKRKLVESGNSSRRCQPATTAPRNTVSNGKVTLRWFSAWVWDSISGR